MFELREISTNTSINLPRYRVPVLRILVSSRLLRHAQFICTDWQRFQILDRLERPMILGLKFMTLPFRAVLSHS